MGCSQCDYRGVVKVSEGHVEVWSCDYRGVVDVIIGRVSYRGVGN